MEKVAFQLGHAPVVGDYYLLKDAEGQIGIVTSTTEKDGRTEISYPHKDHNGSSIRRYTAEQLSENTQYIADGENFIRQRIDQLANEISQVEIDSTGMRAALTDFSPHLQSHDGISEKALAPVIRDLSETRKKIASSRNAVARVQLEVKQKRETITHYIALQRFKMESLLSQQAAALAAKLGDLQNMIAKAEEAIWTLNLYLGKDEQIVQIKKGKAAPKDTKISIRQRVLYADEECALAAEDGGIDAATIEEFDEWLKIPANRQQVLPEPKGVVAFKPRRNDKKYDGDTPIAAWGAAQANERNKKTYFLMVNGENLYRICTELEVSDRLIPVENEYSELFFRSEYDHENHKYKKEPIYPGDSKYMDKLKEANDLQRHYLRILLFLQGLLDRTAVFAPLPAPHLNLLNRQVYLDHLSFITDGEKLLGDGRPSFKDWLSDVNSKLSIGHRIMGSFGNYGSGLRQHSEHGRNHRLSPITAEFPDDLTLYTILGTHERGWFFRYARTETIYRHGRDRGYREREHGPAKRQASCAITAKDNFILNFDVADVDAMKFYLNDRTNRQHYDEMHPILKKAIQLKEKEIQEEMPFRDLLVRQIVKTFNVKPEEVAGKIGDLIAWWKLKNKTHRSLLSDDSKALRMILKEFRLRKIEDKKGGKLAEQDKIAVQALLLRSSPLVIARDRKGVYIRLTPHNDQTPFVTFAEFLYQSPALLVPFSATTWQLIEKKRVVSWTILYQTEDWKKWKLDARESEYLTDPERDKIIDDSIPETVKQITAEVHRWHHDDSAEKTKKSDIKGLVYVTKGNDNTLNLWTWCKEGKVPTHYLTDEWVYPQVELNSIHWKKTKSDGVTSYIGHGSTYQPDPHSHSGTANKTFAPWDRDKIVIRQNEALIEQLRAITSIFFDRLEVRDALAKVVQTTIQQAWQVMADALMAEEKRKFLEEYEHEDLWQDHKKTLHEMRPDLSNRFSRAIEWVVQCFFEDFGMVPKLREYEGKTYGEIFQMAKARGWKPDLPKKRSRGFGRKEEDSGSDPPHGEKIAYKAWQLKDDEQDSSEDSSEDDVEIDDDDDSIEVD